MKHGSGKRFQVNATVEFREFYGSMKDRQLKKSIDTVVDALEQTPLDVGVFVARNLWPEEYKRMGLRNVYKANLAKGARLTYMVALNDDGTGVVRIMEFFQTHKDYAKKFGYEV